MLKITTKMKLNINQAIQNGITAFKEGKPKEHIEIENVVHSVYIAFDFIYLAISGQGWG